MRGRRRAARAAARAALQIPLQRVDEEQHHERHDEHHDGERGGARVVVLLELRDDEQRRDFRFHRHVAGDEDHRAVFAERAREREREARQQRGRHGRQHDAAEREPARRAEACGRLLLLALEILENGLHGAHDERQADEGQRDEHAERRERDLDPERREIAADPAVLRVDGRERDARDRGRQRERQVDDRVDEPLERERVAHQHPCDEKAEHRVHERAAERGRKREPVRREHARRRRRGDELVPRERGRLQEGGGERDQHHEAQIGQRDAERHAESGQRARLAEGERRHAECSSRVVHMGSTARRTRCNARPPCRFRVVAKPARPSGAPLRPRSLRLVDRIEHAAVGEMRLLRLGPAAERVVDRVQLELRELLRERRRHVPRARPVVVARGDLLPLPAVQKVQVRVGELARALLVDHLVDHRHRRLRENARRRHDDLELVGAEFLDRQERLVFPRDQHVADAALHEARRRAARARVEHARVPVQLRDEILRRLRRAARLVLRVCPRGEVVPARAARGFRVRRDDRHARLHEIVPILDALRIALPHEEHDRRRVRRRVVRQTLLPILADEALVRERVDVVRERERDHVGLQPVEHRARLRARAAVRLLEVHRLARPRLPFLAERLVDVLVELARRVVRNVQERRVRERRRERAERRRRAERQ
ncbi:hypothetical protein BURPS1710b_2014 [Burkholderia pseudomallei 1710b]|uniref:Uncharacterized protein n=1 Tax=Burkholderia pseudomallei (strain 1710b) TaxID=320372 RepID=Q3JSP4_BURP1|nr:hypothetical protein BURPS1710b_2014 [Burkholderia pseudomallei 1710b]